MDKDAKLTSFLLHYLQDQGAFSSKREMADTLDVTKRVLQRLMNILAALRTNTLTSGRSTPILSVCAFQGIWGSRTTNSSIRHNGAAP